MSEQFSNPRADAFSKVVQGLLRPLVRALIAQGITARALYDMIKRTYVDVAEQDFRLDGRPPTDSRISVLTGVHRRDVRAFRRNDGDEPEDTGQRMTMIATVLGKWLAGPDTIDAEGRPKPLPRSGDDETSFEALVAAVSRDIRPRTVLDELIRQGLVDADERDGLLHLRADAFLGPADLEQKIHFFADNVGDHIAAAVDNLLADRPPFMERAVFYNRLRAASVDEIEEIARVQGTELLVEINRLANDRQTIDMDDPQGSERFRFGIFFYRVDEADEAPANARPNTVKSNEDEDD